MKIDDTRAADAQSDGTTITLQVLKLVSEARNEHGMRQLDYQRYRQFCTKKVHRLRQTLHLTHKDQQHTVKAQSGKGGPANKSKRSKKRQTSAAQSTADKAKGGNVYTEKTIDIADVKSDRPAQLLLFEAERAWAHSQDLKTQSNEAEQDSVLRRSGLGRARRAVHWTDKLSNLVESLGSRVDWQSQVEVITYSLLIKGSAAFDKGDWEASLEQLCVARVLLTALAKSTADSRFEALANSFIDASEAQMRFSAYQLGEERQDMEVLAQEIASPATCQRLVSGFDRFNLKLQNSRTTDASGEQDTVQIDWRDRHIPLRNADLVGAVLRVRTQEAALQTALEASEQQEGQAVAAAKAARAKGCKPARLTHAERNARKRGTVNGVGESSKATGGSVARSQRGSRSTNDPYDHALAALTDGELLARRLVEDNADALSKSHSARYEQVGNDLKVAHEWLQYRLLSLQIKRSNKMIEEVEQKAQKREARKQHNLKKKLTADPQAKRPGTEGRKTAPDESAVKKEPRKPQPNSRVKDRPTTESLHPRRPPRSGTKTILAHRRAARVDRARQMAEGQSLRRSARVIPALAKLLDNSEANLLSIASLSVIESDPDASTIIDAKSAWYRSQLLYHLARAHALAGHRGEACLLLRRAALCVRQARQALDLVEEVEVIKDLDDEIPPALSDDLFVRSETAIQKSLRKVQKELLTLKTAQNSAAGVKSKVIGVPKVGLDLSSTKAGQQLRLLAGKHVDFDPEDVAEASRLDGVDGLEEDDKEETGENVPWMQKKTSNAAVGPIQEPEDDEAQEIFEEAGEEEEESEESDEFAAAEERGSMEEDDNEDKKEQMKGGGGWLGGWFGRK